MHPNHGQCEPVQEHLPAIIDTTGQLGEENLALAFVILDELIGPEPAAGAPPSQAVHCVRSKLYEAREKQSLLNVVLKRIASALGLKSPRESLRDGPCSPDEAEHKARLLDEHLRRRGAQQSLLANR